VEKTRVIVAQGSGRIIYRSLRPEDNDEEINKYWITQSIMNNWG